MKEDNEYCEKHCKGYRDTGGRCFADGRCDAYCEYQKQKGIMTQISFYDDGTGEFIKQWPNWTGVVPVVGDMVVLHFGDYKEEECIYSVRLRVIDGTRPDLIKLYIRKCD